MVVVDGVVEWFVDGVPQGSCRAHLPSDAAAGYAPYVALSG
jgi:hypothetical protein